MVVTDRFWWFLLLMRPGLHSEMHVIKQGRSKCFWLADCCAACQSDARFENRWLPTWILIWIFHKNPVPTRNSFEYIYKHNGTCNRNYIWLTLYCQSLVTFVSPAKSDVWFNRHIKRLLNNQQVSCPEYSDSIGNFVIILFDTVSVTSIWQCVRLCGILSLNLHRLRFNKLWTADQL